MKHLYIAGPYTQPDPIVNTNAALQVGMALFERDLYVPHVPHLTLLWHLVCPRPIEVWYDLDEHHLARCDAIVRLPGISTGADRELAAANALGLEQIDFDDLPISIINMWRRRHANPNSWSKP